jgi:hypothetical protein
MRRVRSLVAFIGVFAAGLVPFTNSSVVTARAAPASPHMALNCEYASNCAEVANPTEAFGSDTYVGHDEPSAVFYSNQAGAGNQMSYHIRLPRDPSPDNPATKSYTFELNGAQWLGLALCDSESYPEQVRTCTPDSDTNIVDPAVSPNHPGTAFMELQFYAPGWIPWPTWAVANGAMTCDPVKWCVAMNIFGLLEDPVAGTVQNAACQAQIGSIEYVNFAFVTRNGVAQAPANPVDSTLATFTPDPTKDLFMNSGDNLKVSLRDTANGLQVQIGDLTTGQSGSMTASAANGFAQIKFAPTGRSCKAIPYNFHPMYSTSSEQTRVIWAAHTYNVSYSSEIGHFETCSGAGQIPATPFGLDSAGNPTACPAGNFEERGAEPTDGDDNFCFPASEAVRIHINGCTDTNTGFDGLDYQPVWPDGNTGLHPDPFLFSTPLTGPGFDTNYQRMAFEADLPRVEAADFGGLCNRTTGAGCTLIPVTDDAVNGVRQPATFYPYFSAVSGAGGSEGSDSCMLGFGNTLPNTITNFGKNSEYGSLLFSSYLRFGGGGTSLVRTNNFRQVFSHNPCPAATGEGGGD